MSRAERMLVLVALAAAFAVRLAHLGGPLDEPSWRQADTAYMALRMMDESPPDLLNPKAPYRGTNDVKAAEFPIYPAVVSYAYKAFGRESLPLARIVALLFYAGSAWLLFLSLALLFDRRVAAYAATAYAMLPLGIVYARMVHPDFCIVFFSHLFLYGLLRFVHTGRWAWWGVGVVGGTAAFLMKAPYAFYLGLVPAAWWLASRERRTWPRFVGLATVLVAPLAGALWFNEHRIAQEAPFAESLLYPMKWTHESSAGRFFGSPADRADAAAWLLVLRRLVIQVATPAGLLLAAAGLLWRPRNGAWAGWLALWALALGVALYVLLVFPMVAGPHEYYGIPLLAPVSAAAGLALARLSAWRPRAGLVAAALALLAVAGGSAYGLHRGPFLYGRPFFSHDWPRIRAGEAIAQHTQPDDLVLSMTRGRSTGWSDPRILYFANRRGWSIDLSDRRTRELIDAYRDAGARWAAVLMTPDFPPRDENFGPLAGRAHDAIPLKDPAGAPAGWLVLFDLAPP